jgi:hypothetical protein
MCLTIGKHSPKFTLSKETSHATPARRHHTGTGAFHTTLLRLPLGPCLALALGRDADAGALYGDGRSAGDGVGHGRPFHQRPSSLPPVQLVGPLNSRVGALTRPGAIGCGR